MPHPIGNFFANKYPLLVFGFSALVLLILGTIVPETFSHSGGDFAHSMTGAELLFNPDRSITERLFLAPGFSILLGITNIVADLSLESIRVAQGVILLVFLVGTYLLGKVLFEDQKIALGAVTLLFLYIPTLLQIFSLGPTLLYGTWFLLAVLFSLIAEKKQSYVYAVLAGIFFGGAALTDPVGLYVPLVVALWFAAIHRLSRRQIFETEKTKHKKRFLAIPLLIAFVVTIAPWAYRNAVVYGPGEVIIQKKIEVTPFSLDLLRDIPSQLKQGTVESVIKNVSLMVLVPYNLDALNQYARVSYKTLLAEAARGKWIALSKKEFGIFVAKVVTGIYHLTLLALAVMGIWIFRKSQSSLPLGAVLLLLGILLYIIAAFILYGSGWKFSNVSLANGFFFPLMPVVAAFAAAAITHVFDRMRKPRDFSFH